MMMKAWASNGRFLRLPTFAFGHTNLAFLSIQFSFFIKFALSMRSPGRRSKKSPINSRIIWLGQKWKQSTLGHTELVSLLELLFNFALHHVRMVELHLVSLTSRIKIVADGTSKARKSSESKDVAIDKRIAMWAVFVNCVIVLERLRDFTSDWIKFFRIIDSLTFVPMISNYKIHPIKQTFYDQVVTLSATENFHLRLIGSGKVKRTSREGKKFSLKKRTRKLTFIIFASIIVSRRINLSSTFHIGPFVSRHIHTHDLTLRRLRLNCQSGTVKKRKNPD